MFGSVLNTPLSNPIAIMFTYFLSVGKHLLVGVTSSLKVFILSTCDFSDFTVVVD